jgi:hypothetical protein
MYKGMNMIGYDYKPHARSSSLFQLIGKKVDDNTLAAMIVKYLSPPVAREGYEVSMAFEIEDFALHRSTPALWIDNRQASCAPHQGNKNTLPGPPA